MKTIMKILCFEGIDGSGKTTQSLITAVYLSKRYNVVVVKPFSFLQDLVKGKIMLTQVKLKKRINGHKVQYKHKTNYLISILDLGKLLILVLAIKIELFFIKLLSITKHIDIIIYDRFYYDKVFVLLSNKKFQLLALLLIPKPSICLILDVPAIIAYNRMQQLYDKIIPLRFFEYLRHWYIFIGKLFGFPILDISNGNIVDVFKRIKAKIDKMI